MKKLILFAVLIFGSVQGFSQAKPAAAAPAAPVASTAPVAAQAVYPTMSPEVFCLNPSEVNNPSCKAFLEKQERSEVSSKVSNYRSECTTAKSKIKESKTKTGNSCGAARIGGKNIESCASKVNECQTVADSDDELDDFGKQFLTSGQPLTGAAATIFEAGAAGAAQCPNFNSADYESNRKAIMDKQQELKEKAEEIKQTQDAATRKYEEEVAKVEKELKELPAALKLSKEEETAKIQDSISQNRADEAKQQEDISKTEIDISDAIGKIADLEAKRTTELSKITDFKNKEVCKATALALRKSLLAKKGSKSIQTAVKSKQSVQAQVDGNYKACYATLQAQRREINNSFDTQIAAFNKRISVAETSILNLRELQGLAKKAIDANIAKLPEKEKEIEQKFETQRQDLVRQRDALSKEYNSGLEAAQRQLESLSTQNQEQSRLLADLGQKPKPGAKKTTEEVADDLGDYESSLEDAISACFCDAKDSSGSIQDKAKKEVRDDTPDCAKWASALESINDSDESSDTRATASDAKSGSADAPGK